MARKNGVRLGRTDGILRLMRENGSVSIEAICAHLGVSRITARRDLRELEESGFLRRTVGAAVPVEPDLYTPFLHDSTFQDQLERNAAQKRRIGLAAAELVRNGETIACTAGTTTTEVIRCLRHRADLRLKLITNAVNIAMEVGPQKHIDVFLTGGHMRGDWFSLAGGNAIQTLRQYAVDTAFIGVNGIDTEHGLSCFNPDEASLNAAMVEIAKRRIVVADYSKLSVVATHRICPVEAIHLLITNCAVPDEAVAAYAEKGIEVRRV
jgi:DeoR family transcriptional regulator of aga operon